MIPRTAFLSFTAAALPLTALARPQDLAARNDALQARTSGDQITAAVAAGFRREPVGAAEEDMLDHVRRTAENLNGILIKHSHLVPKDTITPREDNEDDEEKKGKGSTGGGYVGTGGGHSGAPSAARPPASGLALVVGLGAVVIAGLMH